MYGRQGRRNRVCCERVQHQRSGVWGIYRSEIPIILRQTNLLGGCHEEGVVRRAISVESFAITELPYKGEGCHQIRSLHRLGGEQQAVRLLSEHVNKRGTRVCVGEWFAVNDGGGEVDM